MKKENKLFEALFAIASGILTEIIYSEISISRYEKKIIDGVETIEEISRYTALTKIGIILLLFFVIWIILSFVLPRIKYIFKTAIPKKKPTYNTKEIIGIFYNTKQTVQNISFVLNNNFSKISFATLYLNDLVNCINKLHVVFCSKNKKQKKTVNFLLYNSLSVNTNGQFISKFEYLTLISIIDNLFNECTMLDNNDKKSFELHENDINELKNKINELKNI